MGTYSSMLLSREVRTLQLISPPDHTHDHTPPPLGLPQLPLLAALINLYKANIRLKNSAGMTPLGLTVQLGEKMLAEV